MRLFNQLLVERSIEAAESGQQPEFTGRYLVLLDEDAGPDAMGVLADRGGLNVMLAATHGEEISSSQVREADAVVFPSINVALVDAPSSTVEEFAAATSDESAILAVEPERIVEVAETTTVALDAEETAEVSVEYRHGYRDAILDMAGQGARSTLIDLAADTEAAASTWGLDAVGVDDTTGTAKGIRVAVLDTGFHLAHPDFAGRTIRTESFISGETVDDAHGHGTHCIGTACGPVSPGSGPRYGIASGADIFVGKVLSNAGSGGDGGILAGIDWAVRNECRIVSMSLGSPASRGQRPSAVYERVARRALRQGTLIVAAAGNDSARPRSVAPVSHPANCPSIMAVAAVDSKMKVASFSNQAMNPQGGEVNLAGPGVLVHSSWIPPQLYRTISGTSMATPHVAGVAAVIAEETGLTGLPLAQEVLNRCRDIGLAVADGGRGLVQTR